MQCQATESRNPQIDLFANTYNQSNIHARDNCSLPTTAVRNTQHLHARLRTYQKAMPHPTFNARDIRANTYNQSNVHARDNCSLPKPALTQHLHARDHARMKRQCPTQNSTRVTSAQTRTINPMYTHAVTTVYQPPQSRNTQHLNARPRTYQTAMPPHATFNARDIRANMYNQSNVHARDNCSLTKPRNHATRSTSTHDHARIKRQYPPKQHSTRVIAAQRLRRSRDPSRKPVFLHLYHTDVSISLLAIA